MPVEQNEAELRRYPVITWIVSLLILLVSCFTLAIGRSALEALAFVPADPFRYGGITWITSFFVHGGILHLVGNLYFLLVFGDNVEDLIGRKRFLLVLITSTLFGDLLHSLLEPRGTIPTVGASGGISGIIALYALAFPQARLGIMERYGWITFSARVGFLAWLGLQLLGAFSQATSGSRTSFAAHLGGCLVGVTFWFWSCRTSRLAGSKSPATVD
jgi:membrane associated rhomboid family serine protease